MSKFFKTECLTESEAIAAYHATEDLFDSMEVVTSLAKLRSACAILWRFDDDPLTIIQMVERLLKTGLFCKVHEIPPDQFWSARSYGV